MGEKIDFRFKWMLAVEPLNYPDNQEEKCKYFGCGATLSLEERRCGDFCQLHSNLPIKSQPHGPEDPVKFVSY